MHAMRLCRLRYGWRDFIERSLLATKGRTWFRVIFGYGPRVITNWRNNEMSKMRKTKELFGFPIAFALFGCIFITYGIYSHSIIERIQERFQTGKWSIQYVRQLTGIQSENDLKTEKEKMLYNALDKTNKQCIMSCELIQKGSEGLLIIGLLFLFLGVNSTRHVIELRKQIGIGKDGCPYE